MRILVACELPAFAMDELRALGGDVIHEPALAADDLPRRIAGVNVLVIDGLRVSPETISRGTMLQMIVRAGAGPGNIAMDEASAQGVLVAHCPDRDAIAIAELTFGLILALDRQIVENTNILRQGRWSRREFLGARGLAGRRLGLVGVGRVGREVIRRARAFEMHIAAWSPTLTPERAAELGVEFRNWPRELAKDCEIVTVHARGGDDQQHPVDAEFLESLPDGAYLVHVGHPSAVDESALVDAIEKRGLRVALDVFSSEPAGDSPKFKSRLMQIPGVIATHHIGGATAQARDSIAAEIHRIVKTFLVSGEVLSSLNLVERSPATWQLVLRARDQVGVMASILDAIRADGINAQEVSSRVFSGAKAALITIALDERPSTEALQAIRAVPDVLHLDLRAVV